MNNGFFKIDDHKLTFTILIDFEVYPLKVEGCISDIYIVYNFPIHYESGEINGVYKVFVSCPTKMRVIIYVKI